MIDRTKAPEVKPFGHLELPKENVEKLSNGLTFHWLSSGDQDVAKLNIIVEGGHDDVDNPCVATFAAELLREGTRQMDSEQIADTIDYNGAWLNSNASGHYSNIVLSSLASKVGDLADLSVDCMIEPTMPQHSFEIIKQKGVAQQKLNLSRVAFLAAADNKRLICGPNHREAKTPTIEQIESITRDELLEFHHGRLDARLMHAYLCGRLDDKLVDKVRRSLQRIPAAGLPSPIEIAPHVALAPQISKIEKADSLQSAVVLSIPSIMRSNPDYNALRMAVSALGGYFGSRLMMNIREDKGYTYGISAALVGQREGGYVQISAQCDNKYTDALIEEVRNELRGMAERPLSDDEFGRLYFHVSSDLASTLDSPFTMMDYYELQLTVGTPKNYFNDRMDTLRHLTPEQICELSKKYLSPDDLRISVAGKI